MENKIVSYEYFMDRMEMWELEQLCAMVPWAEKGDYERTRLLMWSMAAPYFKKGQSKTPEQFMPLYTDEKKHKQYDVETQNLISRKVANMNIFGSKMKKDKADN